MGPCRRRETEYDGGQKLLKLSHWPYIRAIFITGDLKTDITDFLTVNRRRDTLSHCISVAEASRKTAARFGLDEAIAAASAWLHDISTVMEPRDMLDYAISRNWEIDASEKIHPFLLHQRLSAVFARELFGVHDPLILSAVGCHTTLKKNPSVYDMVLFVADKLSWDQARTPPFYDAVVSALEKSPSHASLAYIDFVLDNGMIVSPHPWLMDARNWLKDSQ